MSRKSLVFTILAAASILSIPGPLLAQGAALTPSIDPLVRNMDPSVKPGDDFFLYSCGTWIKDHPIPASERGWSIARAVMEEIYAQKLGICKESAAATEAPAGSSERKVGDFWSAGMDSVGIEARGVTPIQPELDRIAAIKTREDLLRTVAHLQTIGVGALYSVFIGLDDKNSTQYVVFLHQGGLGLDDRDYYFLDDPSTKKIRDEYPKHVAAMLHLLGDDEARAEKGAKSIFEIETALAGASRTLEQRRDPYANYNKMSVDALSKLTPSINWKEQLAAMQIPAQDSVVVGQPEFFSRVDSTLAAHPIDEWKDYLRWHVVGTFAPQLSSAFDKQNFRFYGALMGGAKQQRPRWKRVLDTEENAIGELIGQVWVKRYCSPATKARYEKLVDNIFQTYAERIQELPWMTAATKEKALLKLSRVGKKVGYPDHWRDYSKLSISNASYAGNQISANNWWFRYYVDKLGKPVDRTEWDMTPQTYNAYFDGSKVEIVLPAAAFLVPGIPDSLLDDAILYSYAGGSTIGHEITHGFDDSGRQYDENGNMNPWWTPADSVQFMERAQMLIEQFDGYSIGDKHVRGEATLGENIADLGGVVIAYEAFKKTDQWKKGEKLNGLTPDQRYFLGYALSWLGQERPEALANQIMTDVHAPRAMRVNGPVVNIPAFYDAFDVKPGDSMYREPSKRVVIW